MTTGKIIHEKKRSLAPGAKPGKKSEHIDTGLTTHAPILTLQNHVGNGAIQRLLAQRTGDGLTELDDSTADCINSARGGGQTLDTTIQQKMGGAMGSDFNSTPADVS